MQEKNTVYAIAYGLIIGLWMGHFITKGFGDIKSETKIEPKLIITKQGVKTDTLYVYEKK